MTLSIFIHCKILACGYHAHKCKVVELDQLYFQLFVGNVINQTLFGYHYPYDKCERFVQFVEAFNKQIACMR